MKPKVSPQQQDVVDLLRKLSEAEADYPPELLSNRRRAFQQEVSTIKTRLSQANDDAKPVPVKRTPRRWWFDLRIILAATLIGLLATGFYLLQVYRDDRLTNETSSVAGTMPLNETETPAVLPTNTDTAVLLLPATLPAASVTAIPNTLTATLAPTQLATPSPTFLTPALSAQLASQTPSSLVLTSTEQPASQTPTALVPTATTQLPQPASQTPATPLPIATIQLTQPAIQTPVAPLPTATTQLAQPATETPTLSTPTVTTNPGLHLGQTPGTPAAPGHQTSQP